MDGGSVALDIHDVSVYPDTADAQLGFVIYPAMTEAAVNTYIDTLLAEGKCALDAKNRPEGSSIIDLSQKSTWKDYKNSYEVYGTGMFNILFTRCKPVGADASVSFTIDAAFVNPGPNYLSAGDMPLPTIYTVMTVAFAAALVVWLRYLRANKQQTTRVHHLMTALLLVKVRPPQSFPPPPLQKLTLPPPTHPPHTLTLPQTLDVMFEAAMYYYIASTGHNSAWNSMFYIFSFVKGGLMAVVTLLVGAGWSILKVRCWRPWGRGDETRRNPVYNPLPPSPLLPPPTLTPWQPFVSDREKKILIVALVLQLLTNTAIVMTDELAPGSIAFLAWADVLHIAGACATPRRAALWRFVSAHPPPPTHTQTHNLPQTSSPPQPSFCPFIGPSVHCSRRRAAAATATARPRRR